MLQSLKAIEKKKIEKQIINSPILVVIEYGGEIKEWKGLRKEQKLIRANFTDKGILKNIRLFKKNIFGTIKSIINQYMVFSLQISNIDK